MVMYDPLGLLAYVLVYLKIVLQEVWRFVIQWDDPLNDAQYEKWILLTNVFYSTSPYKKTYDLHLFVDASEEAYAAVVYLRIGSNELVLPFRNEK